MPKTKVTNDPNPWLKIDHEHDWLPANDGKEEVCGLCGLRKDLQTGETGYPDPR